MKSEINSGDASYQCTMVEQPRKLLRSQTVIYTGEGVLVEGFSRDEHGVDTPNGINFVLLTKMTGVEWPKRRKKIPHRESE